MKQDGKSNRRKGERILEGSLERLRGGLYARDPDMLKEAERVARREPHVHMSPPPAPVGEAWAKDEERGSTLTHEVEGASPPVPRWGRFVFVGALAFFLISLGVAAVSFLGGRVTVSSEQVDINIIGPVSVSAGEPLTLEVTVRNDNSVPLEAADLLIEYPEGTRRTTDLASELRRYREGLGTIPSGNVVTRKVQAALFGEEGAEKQVVVSIEYRVAGSNAVFSRKKTYNVGIKSSPLSLTITALKEISSGEEAVFAVDMMSNSSSLLKDVVLAVEFPFGWSIRRSDPESTFTKNTWRIGDLPPGGKRTVKIRGLIEGQDGEERVFRFSAGIGHPKNPERIGTVFLSRTQSVTVSRPFVSVRILVNGEDTSEVVATEGETLRVDLEWKNNLSYRVTDLKLEAKLSGSAYNRSSVVAENGFYRSIDNMILWDQTMLSSLAEAGPGEEGRVSFSLRLLSLSEGLSAIRNPETSISVGVKGDREGEDAVPESVSIGATKRIKVSPNLSLSARTDHGTSPFADRGPTPPRAEQETTYTIVWSLSNSTSDLSNVSVRSILPSYVRWVEVVFPEGERVRFNPVGGALTWDVGDLRAGVGFGERPREVYFQVAITPSIGQIGSSPTLVGVASAEGLDRFTGVTVRGATRRALTTDLASDTTLGASGGAVQP